MQYYDECAVLANLAYAAPDPDPKTVFESLNLPIEDAFFLNTDQDAEMYTLVLPRSVLFLCRGTESAKDVRTDLMVFKTDCAEIPGAKIHRGFAKQYASLKSTIVGHVQRYAEFAEDYARSVVFIGHSLGGALATIGAALTKQAFSHLYVECVSFGCPRVGNSAFATFFNTHIDHHVRFVHGNDIVTKIPRFNYTHVGNERRIGDPATKKGCAARYIGSVGDHSVNNYIEALQSGAGTEKDGLLFN
jgi:triacylglycerol lipase